MSEPNLDRWAREVAKQPRGSMGGGLVLTLVLHILIQVLILIILYGNVTGDRSLELVLLPLEYVGLSQLVYIVPAILIFRRSGNKDTVRGLIIGASVTFLLNVACNVASRQ